MENLSGCLTARLADRNESYEKKLVDEINDRIKPPHPLDPGDVYIRAMYIVSDQINSQGGCFAIDELDRLAQLLVDSPVMVGHQRDSLPLARNFKALKIQIDGRTWVKSFFYWMKDGEGAKDLKNNIDGGIYKECSVSFLFNLPECSICGRDIRECRHIPFQEYEVESGKREIAHFKYRKIEKVLETSFVFRGAIPDTRITNKLSPIRDDKSLPHQPITATHFFKLSDSSARATGNRTYGQSFISFDMAENFVPDDCITSLFLSPYQPGLMLRVIKRDERIELESTRLLSEKTRAHLTGIFSECGIGAFDIDAILYAVKGKERLNGLGLIQLIESEGNLHRLRLKICDAKTLGGEDITNRRFAKRLEHLREFFNVVHLDKAEVRIFQECSREEWKPESTAVEGARYKFGVEAVAENTDGILTRHVLKNEELIPAVIEKALAKNRAHLKCDLNVFGEEQKIRRILFPRIAGLEMGSVTILSQRLSSGNKGRRIWSLVDIVPDGDEALVLPAYAESNHGCCELYITQDGHHLHVLFREGEQWRAVKVFRFSKKLLGQGRRFIADFIDADVCPANFRGGDGIPLRAVMRSGKLMLLNLAKSSAKLGDFVKLWLRPVLIDGEERYLFYADDATRLPAEL